MSANRRDFLAASSVSCGGLSVLGAWLSPLALAQTAPEALDQETLAFWTGEVRKPSEAFARGLRLQGGPQFQPEFVYYDEARGFQAPGDIDDAQLPAKGSMNVSVRVQRFRPSLRSKATFESVQGGSLRVDVKQTTPMPGLSEALAWTAVAALVPTSESKLPDLKNLTFDPGESWGRLHQIPLTNGLGFWSWNFFLKRKESLWGQFVSIFRQADKVVIPLLGLPAIAATALTAVDKLLGWIQANGRSDWLFKSADSPVYATLEGKAAVGQGLPLKTGQYLEVPRDQLSTFGGARRSLELRDGYLVGKGTDPFDRPKDAAAQLPDVDYLSLFVKVTPAT
jgi:hypothetical protein